MIRDLWRRLVVAVDTWLGRQADELAEPTDTVIINGFRYRVRRGPFGIANYPLRPYDERADEIGGRRDYYDGLGD
jgi:hypothetical protein